MASKRSKVMDQKRISFAEYSKNKSLKSIVKYWFTDCENGLYDEIHSNPDWMSAQEANLTWKRIKYEARMQKTTPVGLMMKYLAKSKAKKK